MRSDSNGSRPRSEAARPPLQLVTDHDTEERQPDPRLPHAPDSEPARPLRICLLRVPGQDTPLARSLAQLGHHVTVVPMHAPPPYGPHTDPLASPAASQEVRSVSLPEAEVPLEAPWYAAQSYRLYCWLRQQDFDVVHLPERHGIGYYSLLARRQGLAFAHTLFCVTLQGPHFWRKADLEYLDRIEDLEIDFLERQCIARADVVVSPTQHLLDWLREQGWQLPATCHVQPPFREAPAPRSNCEASGEREFVFVGTLDRRSGLVLFCDALDRLVKQGQRDFRVLFAADAGSVDERDGATWLQERAQRWSFPWRLVGKQAAIEHLHPTSSVAVFAGLREQPTDLIAFCLEQGIPFVTTDVNGVGEMIHPEDRSATVVPCRAQVLAERMLTNPKAARSAWDAEAERQIWLGWHALLSRQSAVAAEPEPVADPMARPLVTVCLPHHNRPALLRQALDSLAAQDYPSFEVIVVDDGSDDPEALRYLAELEQDLPKRGWQLVRQPNRYAGAARNRAAGMARGEYLLFMDDDNVALPNELTTLVRVAQQTGADVVTAVFNVFAGLTAPTTDQGIRHRCLPLGSATAAGAINNCFGDMNALVRKDCFFLLGGLSEDYGKSHEDWEFFARAALRGFRHEVVPEPLFWYRVTEGSITQTTPQPANYWRHLRGYLAQVPAAVQPLLLYAQGMKFRIDALSREHADMFTYAHNLEKHHRNVAAWLAQVESAQADLQERHKRLNGLYDEAQRAYAYLQGQHARLWEYHKNLEAFSQDLYRVLDLPSVQRLFRCCRMLRRLPVVGRWARRYLPTGEMPQRKLDGLEMPAPAA